MPIDEPRVKRRRRASTERVRRRRCRGFRLRFVMRRVIRARVINEHHGQIQRERREEQARERPQHEKVSRYPRPELQSQVYFGVKIFKFFQFPILAQQSRLRAVRVRRRLFRARRQVHPAFPLHVAVILHPRVLERLCRQHLIRRDSCVRTRARGRRWRPIRVHSASVLHRISRICGMPRGRYVDERRAPTRATRARAVELSTRRVLSPDARVARLRCVRGDARRRCLTRGTPSSRFLPPLARENHIRRIRCGSARLRSRGCLSNVILQLLARAPRARRAPTGFAVDRRGVGFAVTPSRSPNRRRNRNRIPRRRRRVVRTLRR